MAQLESIAIRRRAMTIGRKRKVRKSTRNPIERNGANTPRRIKNTATAGIEAAAGAVTVTLQSLKPIRIIVVVIEVARDAMQARTAASQSRVMIVRRESIAAAEVGAVIARIQSRRMNETEEIAADVEAEVGAIRDQRVTAREEKGVAVRLEATAVIGLSQNHTTEM
jgi:hypothetical protein